jgi:hypothetical protein
MTLDIKSADTGHHPLKKVDKQTFASSLKGASSTEMEVMTELRRDTIDIILRTAHKPGEQVVKVVAGDNAVTATVPIKVRGFVTFLRFLKGSGLAELETKLGFAKGALSMGAYIYNVDPFALNATNVVPEGYTDWSDGVTPRELHNLSQKHGVPVTYNPKYPASSAPIIQFRILEDVPYVGAPRFVRNGETV